MFFKKFCNDFTDIVLTSNFWFEVKPVVIIDTNH